MTEPTDSGSESSTSTTTSDSIGGASSDSTAIGEPSGTGSSSSDSNGSGKLVSAVENPAPIVDDGLLVPLIVVGVLLGVCLLVGIIVGVVCWSRRRDQRLEPHSEAIVSGVGYTHQEESYGPISTTSTKYVAIPPNQGSDVGSERNYIEFSVDHNQDAYGQLDGSASPNVYGYGGLPRSSAAAAPPLRSSELPYGEMPKSSEGDSYQALSIGGSTQPFDHY